MVPDQPDLTAPHLVFIESEQGVAYLIDRDDMSRGTAGASRCVFGTCGRDALEHASAAAYWDGGTAGRLIVVAGRGRQPAPCQDTGGVVALRLAAPQAHTAALDVAWCSPSMRDPGAPSVSGMEPDGGVVWVLDTGDDAVLYALDARTGAPVYRSGGADSVGRAQPTVTPAVVGGRVFVGAGNRIEAFGLP